MSKITAHFLLNYHLWNSPPNDALSRIFDQIEYEIDYFSPNPPESLPHISNSEYGIKWLLKNLFSTRWRKYDVYCCTSEDPIFVAGILAFVFRKPLIILCDEIRSGSYSGKRPWWYKKICRWGMRRAKIIIVNDESRIALLKSYAGLEEGSDIVVYPGCFYSPPIPIDKSHQREIWQIPNENLVVAFSGSAYTSNGIEWALQSLGEVEDVSMLIQPLSIDSLTEYLLRNLRFYKNIVLTDKRLSWQESWESMGGVDIGVALYLNPAPQFQNMGISSNRLCMFLAMGVPVITTKQDSFDFLEKYDCGIMVETPDEFNLAVDEIRRRLPEMKQNALRCADEYFDCEMRLQTLKHRVSACLER